MKYSQSQARVAVGNEWEPVMEDELECQLALEQNVQVQNCQALEYQVAPVNILIERTLVDVSVALQDYWSKRCYMMEVPD